MLSQSQLNFAEMILGWFPFKIVSVRAVLYPRWPPLLKIEFFSKGQNCSILSQKVPKFEVYKHNDELFNIYYGIFLWTLNYGGHLGYNTALTDTILKGNHLCIISAEFGWDWLSSFRGEDFFLISSPLFLRWFIFKIVSVSAVQYTICPPLLKI
jgi:hypothetical protein